MKISIGLPPGPATRELAQLAESLGYDRVWLYDSAALYEDIWIHMAQVAEATERVGLGTAVLVPNLRHVMTTASAIATIDRIAPGRLACAVGTGFTARLVLGQKALPWKTVRTWVVQLRALLRGEVVEIDGECCQMIHHPALAESRPIEIPILLSAFGPKGMTITREIADGWMGVAPPGESFDWAVQLVNGTVLDPGEPATSERVLDAAGVWQVLTVHGLWAHAGAAVDALPGGAEWRASVEAARPEAERHLAAHEGHCSHLTERDRRVLETQRAEGDIAWIGWVGEAEAIRKRVEASEAAGVSEILYAPAGPDLSREIRAFAETTAPLRD